MQISETETQNTLLQLFRERGLEAGDELRLGRLEEFWSATTLRRTDLLEAMVKLLARGYLLIDEQDGETWLALTEAGVEHVIDPEWTGQLQSELLPALRRRALQAGPDGRGRRRHEQRNEPSVHWPRG
ncbi:MAG TPA: hypothetical protein VLI06_12255 [Solimonas sp.]|nr:hypothetical protein [Solimonas sp.]